MLALAYMCLCLCSIVHCAAVVSLTIQWQGRSTTRPGLALRAMDRWQTRDTLMELARDCTHSHLRESSADEWWKQWDKMPSSIVSVTVWRSPVNGVCETRRTKKFPEIVVDNAAAATTETEHELTHETSCFFSFLTSHVEWTRLR